MKLPPPPWARRRERCPECLAKLPDDRALVCDRCGYQLRLPRIALVGLALFLAAVASFVASAFGGDVFPWPDLSFLRWLLEPLIGRPTPADLTNWSFWTGVFLALAGTGATYAGAYSVRRRADLVRAHRPA